MPDLAALARPVPATIPVDVDGTEILVIYNRSAFTADRVSRVFAEPITIRLCDVLLDWDITDAGAPLVPRQGADGGPDLTWADILGRFPRDVLRAIDTAILDDFLGVSWRGAGSASGSPPMTELSSTAIGPPGMIA